MTRFLTGLSVEDLEAPLSKAIWIAALFVLTSCANSLDMSDTPIKRPGPEWAVVIGSVLVQPEIIASDRQSTARDASGAFYEFDIVQIQPGDPKGESFFASSYQLDANAGEERIFISRLQPGQYLIRRFRQDAAAGLGGELDLVFDAVPGEVRYIGRIRIDLPHRVSSGKTYRFSIENARGPTLTRVSERYGDLTKAMMDGPMHARAPVAP